jgi:hypothetical protein
VSRSILTSKGTVIPCHTIRKLTKLEIHDGIEKHKRKVFDQDILAKLGDSLTPPVKPIDTNNVLYDNDDEDELV